jgi:hypothetical protein
MNREERVGIVLKYLIKKPTLQIMNRVERVGIVFKYWNKKPTLRS